MAETGLPERIGKYEVNSELGRGSQGCVYRAYDPVTKRTVAIKVLITEDDPVHLARFFLEVQNTAKLNHKHIVTIYEFNKTPPYIVMEFIEGESLHQVIKHHATLSLLDKVRILAQAAEGLAWAHKKGIVHRDIKPANIMVPSSGDVKIMDFGIAWVSGQTEERRTRQGDVAGSVLYLSPQRIRGAKADACSDIFSFGVVGCELITGKHPFEADNLGAIIRNIEKEDVPPLERLIPGCPETLDSVIQRATAKEPGDRYRGMEEVLFDLNLVLRGLAQQQAKAPMREVHRLKDAGKLLEAQDLVRVVLELDPTNEEALSVHDWLQKDQRRRRDRAKVDTFLQAGETQLDQRQFNKAIQSFESALRLDTSDIHITDLLGQAKAALEASRQASQLLLDARREMLAGKLDAAFGNAKEALRADPQHPEAEGVCKKLRQQIEDRDKRLIRQQEQARVSALERDLKQANSLIERGRLQLAIQLLQLMKDTYPGEGDVAALFDRVRMEEQRRIALDAIRAEIQRDLDAGQPDKACEVAARGQAEFGPDPQLIESAVKAERMRARKAALEPAQAACREHNWHLAAGLLEAFLQHYEHDVEGGRLLDEVLECEQAALRLRRHNGRIEAETLIQSGLFKEAVHCLRALQGEFPGDTNIRDDLSRALDAVDHKLRRETYTQGRQRAGTALRSGRFAAAIKILEALLGQFPDDSVLEEDLKDARLAHSEQTRRERYAYERRRADGFVQARQFDDAVTLLRSLLVDFPADALLEEDLRSAVGAHELQQQREALNREVAELERLYRKGDARAVHERGSLLSPDLQDARVRELLDWARTEIGRSEQQRKRESADSLQRKRRRRINTAVAVAAGVMATAVLITSALRKPLKRLFADQRLISFNLPAGAAAASRPLSLNGSTEGIHWAAKASQPWLSVEPRQGVTPTRLMVWVDPSRLAADTDSAQLTFTTEDGTATFRSDVRVTLVPKVGLGARELQKDADPRLSDRTGSVATRAPAVPPKLGRDPKPVDSGGIKGGRQPQPAPEIIDCYAVTYYLPRKGTLKWQSTEGLGPDGFLVIGGPDEHLGGGQKTGAFPGCKITVNSPTPGIQIDEPPRPEDGYRRIKLHNSSKVPIIDVELKWSAPK